MHSPEIKPDFNASFNREPIIIDGKKFVWDANFPMQPYGEPRLHVSLTNFRNKLFALTQHGVGVIPELPGTDHANQPVKNLLSFYKREGIDLQVFNEELSSRYPEFFASIDDERYELHIAGIADMDRMVDEVLNDTGVYAKLAEIDP